MSTQPEPIRVVAICIIRSGDEILVTDGFDHSKGKPFHRPLWGGVEPGETSSQAVEREIGEELDQKVEELRLLGTLENIFT